MTTARPAPLDDRSLIRSVLGGSTSSLAGLYERTASVLYPLALRITGTADRACSVLEDLFDEVWRDRESLRPGHGIPLGAMIHRCRELALAQAQARTEDPRRPATAELGSAPPALPPTGNGGGGAVVRDAVATTHLGVEDLGPFVSRQAACDAIEALPERDRLALEEAFFRGTSAREIAVMVGTPTSEAEALLRSALVRFRNHIDAPDGLEAGTGTEG
jgi:RNA polymerase sigma-70 factor (ECF subfamily)